MAYPNDNAVSIALAQIEVAMREYWDPRVLVESQRLNDATKYFNPRTRPWPAGSNNRLHITVQDRLLRSARAIGDMSVSTGVTLLNPAQTIGYAEWDIGEDDLMAYQCPVTYRFKTNQIIGNAGIGPIAERLSRESLDDMNERLELAIVSRQTGVIGRVAKVTSELTAYGATWAAASTHARLWLNDGVAARFKIGDKLEIVSGEGNYLVAPAVTGTQPSTFVTVTNTGFERADSGKYGYLDVKAGIGSTFHYLSITASSGYILFANEYESDVKPGAAPADAASAKNMYGLEDWFAIETSGTGTASGFSPGTIYNMDRATAGNQWAVPLCVPKSTQTTITLSDIDEALLMVHSKRLADPRLTEYVVLCGQRMAQKISELVGSANRRLDTPGVEKTRIHAHYGFNGTMIHNTTLDTAVAVQGVRGMSEDRVYIVQPGILNLIMPGGVQWMPWDAAGQVWQNVTNSSAARTDVYRADRVVMGNSLIELPRLNVSILNVKPD